MMMHSMHCPPRRRRTACGFTLIEVLIAVAIMIALVGSMFAFLNNLLASRGRMMEQAEKHLVASTLIDRIESNLMTTLVGDSRFGAGIQGSEQELTLLHRSVPAHLAERGMDAPEVFGDLQQTTYRFSPETGLLEARTRALIADASSDPAFWSIGRLGKVRFKYHDGRGWSDSFNSLSTGQLPVAIEVAIWFSPWPGEEQESPEENEDGNLPFGDEAPDRLTFSTEDVFDENALENSFEFQMMAPPPPDRIRVIAIPDATGDDETDAGETGEVLQ